VSGFMWISAVLGRGSWDIKPLHNKHVCGRTWEWT
jgi:hypothetical protein